MYVVVSMAFDTGGDREGVEVGDLARGEGHGGGVGVFFETFTTTCAGNGYVPRVLREESGQGDLPWCCAFSPGDHGYVVDEGLVCFPVFCGESGDRCSDVLVGEDGVRVDGAGEESFAEGG